MNELAVFTYSDNEVRTILRDGEPWFVAIDVCAVLGIGNPSQAISYLDDDERSETLISNEGTPGNPTKSIVSEAGLYSLILRSRKPEAKAFKRWVTHEVLPAIRKTGRYEPGPTVPQSYAEALQLAADQAREIEAQAAALAAVMPKVEAWEHLASAAGDYAVADAAKILSRDPAIRLGRDRLFSCMRQYGWVYRRKLDGRWTVYQVAIDSEWLSELPTCHYHPRTGELILDPPQVRVTLKGLAELHRRLTDAATDRWSRSEAGRD